MSATTSPWYPGFGEVEVLRRMPPEVRGFLSDAAAHDPSFVSEYLIPALGRPNAYARIMEDILGAVGHEDGLDLHGFLGGVDFEKFSGLGATAAAAAGTIASKLSDVRLKIQAAIDQARAAAQIQAEANQALVKARLQPPKQPNRNEVAQQQIATLYAAKDAGSAAAAQVKASGGTVADQKAAASQASTNLLTQVATDKRSAQVAAAKKTIADTDSYMKSQWYYNLPWYAAYDSSRTLAPFRRASDIDWMIAYVKRNGESSFPEPPQTAPEHGNWWEVMIRVYGGDKYPPPPPGSPLAAQWKEAYARATHPGGTFGAVARVLTAPVRFVVRNAKVFGNILINVVGAVLSPFTGGASLVAAGLLTAANSARMAANAARAAKNAAAADATQKQNVAAQQTADTQRQVDAFYGSNQAWFQEHGITPDKWAALNLDQKVAVIQAGANGSFPSDPQPILSSVGQPSGSSGASAQAAPSGGGSSSYGGGSGGGGGDGGGLYPDGTLPSGGAAPGAQKPSPAAPAQAGMLDGATLPLIVAGVGLALIFGKAEGRKSRRTKRNPRRGMRRSA